MPEQPEPKTVTTPGSHPPNERREPASKEIFGLTVRWVPREALLATLISIAGVSPIYFTHPDLHWTAYAFAWLLIVSIVYQTGCELSERKRR